MTKKKLDVLRDLRIGNQVAEEEPDTLREYFVQTDTWRTIYRGEIDIVYGAKGAGKSAIYVLIQQHENDLAKKGIILVAAENVRGDPAFSALVVDPPASEREFESLWKIYFLSLIGREFKIQGFECEEARTLISALETASLLPSRGMSLSSILRTAQSFVRKRFGGVETTVHFDQHSGGVTGITGRIVFDEPTPDDRKSGDVSVAELFDVVNTALAKERKRLWLLLDRLDVAFDDSADLEKNALRALFRAYLSLNSYQRVVLKIFLRSDIWNRITEGGFREATHLSRDRTITWDTASLKNLLVSRLISNHAIRGYYRATKTKVLQDVAEQDRLFYKVFPAQVRVGAKQSTTMDWLIKRTADGTGKSSPRELVLFLKSLRDVQIRRLEHGEPDPPGETLFDRAAFEQALVVVSEYRTTKVLYAEHPDLKELIEGLRGTKSEQDIKSLMKVWGKKEDEAKGLASRLVTIGFFEYRADSGTFWVPYVYRPYLALIQGRAG